MSALVASLIASNLVVATAAFALLARPEGFLGPAAWLLGRGEAWRTGRLSDQEERDLLALLDRGRWLVLALVFGWSFVCGATVTWARL